MNYLLTISLLLSSACLLAQTTADINWLNKHISPIRTVKAGSELADLHPLKAVVEDASIVALGECTHGSREIFQMKHRLLEYLVEEMHFTIFAIEGDVALAGIINDFILTGKGDSASVVGSLETVWRTQEVWEMIQWMRSYNQTKENKIQFMGFDMQIPWGVLQNLERFAKESDDAQLADWLRQVSTLHQQVEQTTKSTRATKRNLLRLSEQVEKKISATEATAFIRQNAQALVQLAKMQQAPLSITGKAAYNARDKAMAENVEAILRYNPAAKVVLWAHNGHVNKIGGLFKTLGYYLQEKFGSSYVSVGFSTGKGSYTAVNRTGTFTRNNQLLEPFTGSFESLFDQAGESIFLLNCKLVSPQELASKWLFQKKMFRSIGALVNMKPEYQFIPYKSLPDLFDAVIYFKQTTASDAYMARD
jgi:erythromycin esterase